MALVSGTEGYAEQSSTLIGQYDGINFAGVHRDILHLIPKTPAAILDIGAGTGRDAAALARMGHRVVAIEPTAQFRAHIVAAHPSPPIEAMDDHLPDLPALTGRGGSFGLILMQAVWMHLDREQRAR